MFYCFVCVGFGFVQQLVGFVQYFQGDFVVCVDDGVFGCGYYDQFIGYLWFYLYIIGMVGFFDEFGIYFEVDYGFYDIGGIGYQCVYLCFGMIVLISGDYGWQQIVVDGGGSFQVQVVVGGWIVELVFDGLGCIQYVVCLWQQLLVVVIQYQLFVDMVE